MSVFGFCLSHRSDMPVGDDRHCLDDGSLAIPPSWSSKHATYPWPPRPEGFVYEPPASLSAPPPKPTAPPKKKKPFTPAPAKRAPQPPAVPGGCPICGKDVPPREGMGVARLYCTRACKATAQRRKLASQRTEQFRPYPCERCPTLITTPSGHGGRPQRFCSDRCRRTFWKTQPRKEPAA